MTKEQTAKLIAIIKEFYPNDKEATDINNRVNTWYKIFKDYDFNEIQMAVVTFVTQDTKGFPPSVGQIIDKLNSLKNTNNQLTEMEAWTLVRKAIGNSNYNATQEFEKLPELIQQILGSPNTLKEWGLIEKPETLQVIASNFMRSYVAKATKFKECQTLPSNVKNYIEKFKEKLALNERSKQVEK